MKSRVLLATTMIVVAAGGIALMVATLAHPTNPPEDYWASVERFNRWCPAVRKWAKDTIPLGQLRDVLDFDIPAGSVDDELLCLSRQSGILVEGNGVEARLLHKRQQDSLAVKGHMSVLAAATLIVHGTDFLIAANDNPEDSEVLELSAPPTAKTRSPP